MDSGGLGKFRMLPLVLLELEYGLGGGDINIVATFSVVGGDDATCFDAGTGGGVIIGTRGDVGAGFAKGS